MRLSCNHAGKIPKCQYLNTTSFISEIETGVEILENFVLLVSCELTKYNPKNVRIVTIAISNEPLKESARLFCEISNASSNESNAKKRRRPMVNAKKN